MKYFFISLFFGILNFQNLLTKCLKIQKIGEYFYLTINSSYGIIDFSTNISFIKFINNSNSDITKFIDGDIIISNIKINEKKVFFDTNLTITERNGTFESNSTYYNNTIKFLIGLGKGSEFYNNSYTIKKTNISDIYELLFDINPPQNIPSFNFFENKNLKDVNLFINGYSILKVQPNITLSMNKNKISFSNPFYKWYLDLMNKKFQNKENNFYIKESFLKSLDKIGLKIDDSIYYFSTKEIFNIEKKNDTDEYNLSFKFEKKNDLKFSLGITFFLKYDIFCIDYSNTTKIYLGGESYYLNYSKLKNSIITIQDFQQLNNYIEDKNQPGQKYFIIFIIQILSLLIIGFSYFFFRDDKSL